MKLVSFNHQGTNSYGVVRGNRVLDLGALLGPEVPDLKTLIALDYLGRAAALSLSNEPTLSLAALTLLPVIPNPGKIVCIGLNYGEHVRETEQQITESPTLFLRVAESQVGHGQDILRPAESQRLDYEGEIAIVIGKGGRRISEENAWDHIAGYACYNEGSIRDWQVSTTQWTPGKNFFATGAFGPWLVTADEIAPAQVMTLVTRLNGREVQRATTDMMIHRIPRQIAYISTFTPLSAGDVIVTGTPGGVGNKRKPPLFMQPGDVVEVEVDAIGVLRNPIRDE